FSRGRPHQCRDNPRTASNSDCAAPPDRVWHERKSHNAQNPAALITPAPLPECPTDHHPAAAVAGFYKIRYWVQWSADTRTDAVAETPAPGGYRPAPAPPFAPAGHTLNRD